MQQSSCGHLFFESGLPDGFIIPGVLPADFILQFKEPVDIHDPLDRCLRVVELLSLGIASIRYLRIWAQQAVRFAFGTLL